MKEEWGRSCISGNFSITFSMTSLQNKYLEREKDGEPFERDVLAGRAYLHI